MARKSEQSTGRSSGPLRVKVLRFPGGASLERHIPVDVLQDDICKANHTVWGDIAIVTCP
jgi:hypothetical protein